MTKHQSKKAQRELAWHIRVATTLMGWAVAFVIIFTILSLFGKQLESLPVALNALILTGILVTIMGNLVMPAVNKFAAKHITR